MNRADYEVGTLESEIKVQFEQAVSALNQTTTALGGVTSGLKDVISQLHTLKGETGLKEVSEQAKNLNKMSFGDAVKSTVKLGVIFGTLRKGFNTVKDITSASIDMIETTNLFEVQMGKVVDEYGNLDEAQSQYYTKAMAFQDRMNEKLATNKSEMQKYQAMYYGMLNSQLGSNNRDASYLMSESLTKAGYDIASLYNLDVETAMNKLKSGLAGQIESLRQIGIDVSEASLARVLDQVGIERSVQQLSYAEKEVARYIAICQQAGQAQGDFARTFEQPANQIRVFKNQMIELKQVAGSFFVGLFGQIMPVINGIIMAIKEILKALGSVFGFEVDTGNSSLGTVADTVGDIDSGIGSATKKAKEFKKQLMGFDEINNITPPSENSGGSGGGSSVNGIDSALLDALKEWDNKMDSISGKAQEIRDKMLEWLGFVRNDDGTWKLGEGLTNFEKILDIVKAVGIAIATWKVSSAITNLLKNLGLFGTGDLAKQKAFQIAFGLTLTLTGVFLLYKGIKHILDGNVDIFTILETALGGVGVTFGIATLLKSKFTSIPMKNALQLGFDITLAIGGIILMYNSIKKIIEGNADFFDILTGIGGTVATGFSVFNILRNLTKGTSLNFGKGLTIAFGITLLISSITLAGEKGKEFAQNKVDDFGERVKENLLDIGTSAVGGSITGGTIGSIFGPLGTAIGAGIGGLTGAVASLVVEEVNYTNQTKEVNNVTGEAKNHIDELRASYEQTIKSIEENRDASITELGYIQKLTNELQNLVSSNGKVIKGNEERVDFILGELSEALGEELTRDGNLIKKNGEVVTSYKDLQKYINKTIEAREKEIEQQALQELYKEAIKEQITLERELEKARQDGSDSVEELTKAVEDAKDKVSYYSKQMNDSVIKDTKKLSVEMVKQGEVSSKSLQKVAKDNLKNWNEVYDKLNQKQQTSMLSQSTTLDTWSPTLEKKWKDLANNSLSEFIIGIANVDKETRNKIISTITTTEGLTPNMQKAWKWLATLSKEEYNNALSTLDDSTRVLIETLTNTTENLSPDLIQKWADLAIKDKQAYENNLAELDNITKNKIQDCVNVVNNNRSIAEGSSKNFAKSMEKGFNNINAKKIGLQATNDMINEINNKKNTAEQTGKNLAKIVEKGLNAINTVNAGKQAVAGVIKGINQNKNSQSLWNAISGVVSNVKGWFNNLLGIHSPSKVMADLAQYIPEGVAKGISDNIDETTKPMKNLASNINDTFSNNINIPNIAKELNQGIKINTKDFAVDTNQYINYGAIKGQIQAQSQVSINDNITNRIAEAVAQSMRNAEVNVNIEAKTEEGIIFKKVQKDARAYTLRTGKPAFNY